MAFDLQRAAITNTAYATSGPEVGVHGIDVTDALSAPFAISQTGWYDINVSCQVDGGLWAFVLLKWILAISKGVFTVDLDLSINYEGSNLPDSIGELDRIYSTDTSLTALLTDLTWAALDAAAAGMNIYLSGGGGSPAAVIGAWIGATENVEQFTPKKKWSNDPFVLHARAYLEGGKTYNWSLAAKTRCVSIVGGPGQHCSYAKVIVRVTDVAISGGPPTGVIKLWTNPAGGSFGDGQNWMGGAVPGAPDVALFNLRNTYTVAGGGWTQNDRLIVCNSDLTLSLANVYALANSDTNTPSIELGGLGADPTVLRVRGNDDLAGWNMRIWDSASVLVTNGGGLYVRRGEVFGGKLVFEPDAWFIKFGDDHLIAGSFDSWLPQKFMQGGIDVGRNGQLIIADGGRVSSPAAFIGTDTGASSHATVTGTESVWSNSGSLTVGFSSAGWLTVAGGATVISSNAWIGFGQGSVGNVTIGDYLSVWSNTSDLVIGYNGQGTMVITNGGSVCNSKAWVGSQVGAVGQVTISGVGSTWTNVLNVHIGTGGQGTLKVTDGGKLFTKCNSEASEIGENGTVEVSGNGSLWVAADAPNISGTLVITNGGVADLSAAPISPCLYIDGNVVVTGAGSALLASGTDIGPYGQGMLRLSAGATMMSDFTSLGYNSSGVGTLTVSGAGSVYTESLSLLVGRDGKGSIIVTDGGRIASPYAYIGYLSGSSGAVVVSGAGSVWANAGSLSVGGIQDAYGALTVQDGGIVSNGMCLIGWGQNCTGTVAIVGNGSSLVCGGSITVGYGTISVSSGGRVTMVGSSTYLDLRSGAVLNMNGGTLSGSSVYITGGRLSGEGTIVGNVSNIGELSPGSPTGTLNVLGDYAQYMPGWLGTGSFKVGLAGSGSGQFGSVSVSGNAHLVGTASVFLVNGFVPQVGDSFAILSATSISGRFDSLILPSLPPDRFFSVTYGAANLTLTVVPPATRIIGLSGNLAFGNVQVGQTATRTLTISNSGSSTLNVSGISYPSGFSGSWSGSIGAGGSQNVTVTFAPTQTNSYGGTVTVNSDATSGINTISASGTGTSTPCSYMLSATSTNIAAAGGSGSFMVYANDGCSWSSVASINWIHTTSSGSATGTVSYTVDANSGSGRIGTISVGGQTFTVNQAAGPLVATGQRQMENLGRGVVAVRTNSDTAYIGWRILGTDPDDIAFNLYRSTDGGAPVQLTTNQTQTTDFVDASADLTRTNSYFVRPVLNGVEQAASASYTLPANAPIQQYISIAIQPPPILPTANGSTNYTYSANDCSVGDLDGDGEYEIVLKWDPSNAQDNANSGFTGPVYIDAYKLNGTRLWRIDLGLNIRAGAHYTQFIVYDLDGDGKAELACKTAPGTIDGQGNYVLMPGDDPSVVYTNSSGYILSGPEYLTVFNGQTGAALATTNYVPSRGNVSDWGDNYGNRVDRFLACVAYLDGVRPSLVMCRGYYTGPGGVGKTVLAAWDWRNGQLTQRWVFEADPSTNGTYLGQGNHNLSVGDVDGDGKDEIVYGACAIDHDGTGLYTTGWGHGDAMHLSDMDPDRPGLEVWDVHEPANPTCGGGEFRDARTGALLWGLPSTSDTGRGCADNITSIKGYQMWSAASDKLYDCKGQTIGRVPGSDNFLVWWDADVIRELLDSNRIDKYGTSSDTRLLTASECSANNGTKATPCLSADILGDWREEVIWRTSDGTALHIYTTVIPATNRFYTFMHDPQYRLSIAWQNVAYNQPPHTGFYVGYGMQPPPLPPVSDARLVWRGGNAGNAWDVSTSTNWSSNGVWTNTTVTVFSQGDTVLFDLSGSNTPPVNLVGALQPGKVTVYTYSPKDYVFAGSGSLGGTTTLVKAGTGMLTINMTNNYSGGTTIRDGTLTLGATAGAGAGTLTLYGGTLALTASGNPATYANALNVALPSTLTSPGVTNADQSLSGAWSGAATLKINTGSGGTLSVQGDMSGFNGTIVLTGGGAFQFFGNTGTGAAAFDLGSGTAVMQTRDGGAIALGSLSGGDTTILRGAGSTANPSTYSVGGNNASTTMSGTIADGTAGAGATVSVTKVGSGTWTLTGSNTYSGTTTVSNGALLVNGSLGQSPVTVASGGRIGGSGRLGQGLTVQAGGSVITGSGTNMAGTLTISNGLTQLGGVVNYIDLSNDPTGTNDLINVIGNLTLSGTNTILVNLLNGPLSNGVYQLIRYGDTLIGSLSNLTVIGVFDTPVTLTNLPGAIALVMTRARSSANVTWVGDGVANNWDAGATSNWWNGATRDRFYTLDSVTFNNSGSTNPPVNLVGSLKPASVVVDATVDYTFSGTGSISVPASLTKTNSGTLTILSTNDYTGRTIISGGTLAVSTLATGGVPSSIGASSSDPTNLVLNGGTLRYLGPTVSVDRGAMLDGGGGTIEVATSNTALTLSGAALVGSGGLTKTGAGTLALSASNTYSGGTVLQAGTLRLDSDDANRYGLGTGGVTFSNNAVLQMYGYGAGTSPTYGWMANTLIVPAGQAGTLLTPPRCDLYSTLTGSGTLNVVWDYVRMNQSGNWSAFTGRINIAPRSATAEFRINNTAGYPNAALYLSSGVTFYHISGNSRTIDVGELAGDSGATLGPGNGNSANPTWRVGAKNTSATFAGRIVDAGRTAVTKVGSGTWTLTGSNTYGGSTTVSNGTLLVNNTSGSGTGTGAVTVASGATLGGSGIIGGPVTVNGTLAPGNPDTGVGVGTLTISNSLVVNSGAVVQYALGTSSDRTVVSGNLTLGGTLNVTDAGGFTNNAYTLFTYGGALTYNGVTIGTTPTSSFGYAIDTNTAGVVKLDVILPPVITAGLTVTNGVLQVGSVAVVVAGDTNVFSVGATDPHPLSYQWSFGDGTTNAWSPSSTAEHAYTTNCGPYDASVTVSNGWAATSSNLTVSVACQLNITKLQATLNFAKTNADRCTVKGAFDPPADYTNAYSFAGKLATLDIGGADVSFTLGSKGSGRNGLSTFSKPTYNKKTGLWTFNATLKNGSWRTPWAAYSMINSNIPKPGALVTNLPVIFLLDTEAFMGTTNLHYTAKQGKSGTAK
jgi:T5SS/PEP-CTERM-associated repeat protein/autotransporter-associated beta strand protein